MNEIEINPQFESVLNFVNQTDRLVFLTGRAGTGKTTLLKLIRENTFKQTAIVAPTGVAAINAGGSTIHSFFQFPFAPFLPAMKEQVENAPVLKYNSQRLSIFRKLELLVIDEISMVRSDLLDQIDATLRQTRKKWHQPFGGVQVLLIGDMHQLPPVVQPGEWSLLQEVYDSPYFFDSLVIRSNKPVYIELQKIYRQKEQNFIELLNKVRNNRMEERDFQLLNQHYQPQISQEFVRSNITLTTHNKKADDINTGLLNTLPAAAYTYPAKVEGTFSEKSYPADEKLLLKKGARVMFLKNNNEKNYYNGKIGVVTFLDNDHIRVKCEEDHVEIEVSKETWTNVTYSMNKQSRDLEEEIIGSFTQFPLRLAWAITIHKSQGLSFDKVIIDAAHSFSAGQVYVALSRCRGLAGLTLSSRVSPESFFNDQKIGRFSATRQEESEVHAIFKNARGVYIKTLLLDLFDFSELAQFRQELAGVLQAYTIKIHQRGHDWCTPFFAHIDNLYQVGNRFRSQLTELMEAAAHIETDENSQLRIRQAVSYFHTELDNLLMSFKSLPAFTESKSAADELNTELQKIFEGLFSKNALLESCRQGFRLDAFLNARLKMGYPATKVNVYENVKNTLEQQNVKYPDLYRQLAFLRDEICNDHHKPIYLVANAKTLKELVEFLPTTDAELLKISGFGEAKVEAFGKQFLAIIKEYISEHNIVPDRNEQPPKQKKEKKKKAEVKVVKEKKPSSEQTFELFKQGLSIQEIAIARKFAVSTLEGHLASYVASGDIPIDRVVSPEKQKVILNALEGFDKNVGLGAIKNSLPQDISYSELRYVLAYKNGV